MGATFTPDVFAAAVSMVGPSSLVTLVRSFPPYWRPAARQHVVPLRRATPTTPRSSPTSRPARRSTASTRSWRPLLVIQGANDPRVTKAESDQIVAALRARGVEVEYMVKDDEGHGFVKPENRMDAYGAIERFFARHLGGRIAD